MADGDKRAPASAAPGAGRSDLPIRLASAAVMLALAGLALWQGGRVLDLFIGLPTIRILILCNSSKKRLLPVGCILNRRQDERERIMAGIDAHDVCLPADLGICKRYGEQRFLSGIEGPDVLVHQEHGRSVSVTD